MVYFYCLGMRPANSSRAAAATTTAERILKVEKKNNSIMVLGFVINTDSFCQIIFKRLKESKFEQVSLVWTMSVSGSCSFSFVPGISFFQIRNGHILNNNWHWGTVRVTKMFIQITKDVLHQTKLTLTRNRKEDYKPQLR